VNLEALLAANPNPTPIYVLKKVVEEATFQFSASQIETFRDCPRKWAYNKIDRKPRTQNEAAQLGSTVHDLREKWLRDSIMPDGDDYPSMCARAGIEQLPMPGMASVEGKIFKEVVLSDGRRAYYIGYIDFFIEDQGVAGYWPPEPEAEWTHLQDGVPLVGDHKTTGRAIYIKTPEILVEEDPQGAMYGMWALDRLKRDVVDLFWHYIVKNKKPKPVPVRVRTTRAKLTPSYLKVLDDAGRMMSYFDTPGIQAKDVPPDPRACDKYGGCPHRDYCPVTTQEKIGALMSGGDLEAMLKGMNNGEAAAPVPGNTVAAPTTPTVVPTDVAAADGLGGLAAMEAAMNAGVTLTTPPAESTPSEVADAAVPPEPGQAATPATQPGALAALMGESNEAPAPTQTVAQAAQALTDAEKLASTAVEPPAVLPPDAPPADLDAVPPDPVKKASKAKRQSTLDKRREAISTQLLGALIISGHDEDDEKLTAFALRLTDALIVKLDG
jgi:hypothetical protein